jgi:hypothetical protein
VVCALPAGAGVDEDNCCSNLSSRSARKYYERESQARYEGYQNRCSSYGFTPGSQPYANCMMGLDQQETANRQALVGAYLANQPHPQPYVLPMPAPVQPVQQSAPRTCQSTVNGQVINTTCY